MRKVLGFLDRRLEEVVACSLISIMIVGLVYSAVVRYFITIPAFTRFTYISEEASLFAFIWFVYFGAVIAARDGAHFRVSAQFSRLPPRWQPWRFVVADAIWILFNLFVIWQGAVLVRTTMTRTENSLALGLPMWVAYLIIPISFFLISIRLVQNYIRNGRREFSEIDEILNNDGSQNP